MVDPDGLAICGLKIIPEVVFRMREKCIRCKTILFASFSYYMTSEFRLDMDPADDGFCSACIQVSASRRLMPPSEVRMRTEHPLALIRFHMEELAFRIGLDNPAPMPAVLEGTFSFGDHQRIQAITIFCSRCIQTCWGK